MFSPETYALLNGKISANTDAIAGKWTKNSYNMGANFRNNLNTAYEAASEYSMFSGTITGTYSTTYFICVKDTAARATAQGIAIMAGTEANNYILFLSRSSSGKWSAYTLE